MRGLPLILVTLACGGCQTVQARLPATAQTAMCRISPDKLCTELWFSALDHSPAGVREPFSQLEPLIGAKGSPGFCACMRELTLSADFKAFRLALLEAFGALEFCVGDADQERVLAALAKPHDDIEFDAALAIVAAWTEDPMLRARLSLLPRLGDALFSLLATLQDRDQLSAVLRLVSEWTVYPDLSAKVQVLPRLLEMLEGPRGVALVTDHRRADWMLALFLPRDVERPHFSGPLKQRLVALCRGFRIRDVAGTQCDAEWFADPQFAGPACSDPEEVVNLLEGLRGRCPSGFPDGREREQFRRITGEIGSPTFCACMRHMLHPGSSDDAEAVSLALAWLERCSTREDEEAVLTFLARAQGPEELAAGLATVLLWRARRDEPSLIVREKFGRLLESDGNKFARPRLAEMALRLLWSGSGDTTLRSRARVLCPPSAARVGWRVLLARGAHRLWPLNLLALLARLLRCVICSASNTQSEVTPWLGSRPFSRRPSLKFRTSSLVSWRTPASASCTSRRSW